MAAGGSETVEIGASDDIYMLMSGNMRHNLSAWRSVWRQADFNENKLIKEGMMYHSASLDAL